SKSLSKFDYGPEKNIAKYNSVTPPLYNLKNIKSTNIALISALNDLLAAPLDVQFIRNELRGKLLLDHIVPDPQWNHIAFLWGLDAAKFVNFHILRILEMFRKA
ncbi:Lysosomal acid lipase/cholesteryl ester hydrolase precursor-like protein, partial [Leptotrombidium deliense]